MGLAEDIALFTAKLDSAIYETLATDVADVIKDEMSKNLESYTYTRSRGPSGGGVRDQRNFRENVAQVGDATVLNVTDVADFQTPGHGGSLAEAVETGDRTYRMPGPRPFIAPTQQKMDGGAGEREVADGLSRRGFTVTSG